jgi:hypothetical protein
MSVYISTTSKPKAAAGSDLYTQVMQISAALSCVRVKLSAKGATTYQPSAKRWELRIVDKRAESPPYAFIDRAFSPPIFFMCPVLALRARLV